MIARAAPPTALHAVLTQDGALALTVDRAVVDRVQPWLPAHLRFDDPAPTAPAATILVRAVAEPRVRRPPSRGPDLIAGPVQLWRDADRLLVQHVGAPDLDTDIEPARCCAMIDLARARATIETTPTAPLLALHAMLLLASAYLLGRLGRALVHGASLIAPDGRAWLLVGDTHAGKTTTCATLVDAGWQYCADDHTILSSALGGGVRVEGWPRVFHLDHGWEQGTPVGGVRRDLDAFARWPGRWRATAPFGGLIATRVDADENTVLAPLGAPARLGALLRQSPWLTVDPVAAPALLALLQRVATRPGAALRLGRDTFGRPGPLAAMLAPLTTCA